MKSLTSLAKRIPLIHSLYAAGKDTFYSGQERKLFTNYAQYKRALFNKESGRVTILTNDGLKITIRKNIWDARILREIFIKKPYTRHCKLSGSPVIVDIGGYIGDFSMYCAKYLNASTVIVYEPTKENYEILLGNVHLNELNNIIRPVNKAVGISGELILNVQSLDNDEYHVSSYWYEGCERRSSECVSLNDLYTAHGLDHVDLLKIDCEGSEYDIIPGISDNILNVTQNIVFEFHKIDGYIEKLNASKQRLLSAGFTLYKDRSIISACRV